MKKVNIMTYDTLEAFVADCDKPSNNTWAGKHRYSQDDSQSEWCGGVTYQEARKLALYGWEKGLKDISEKLSLIPHEGQQRIVVKDVCGHSPDVARFVAGLPDCMNRRTTGLSKRKPCLDILVNAGFSGCINAGDILNYGAAIASLIDSLERAGYSLSIIAGSMVKLDSQDFGAFVRLKNHGEPLDMDRLAFFIAHPASLRRLRFSHREVFCTYDDIGSSYGGSIDVPKDTFQYDLYFPRHLHKMPQCSTVTKAMSYVIDLVKKQQPELLEA